MRLWWRHFHSTGLADRQEFDTHNTDYRSTASALQSRPRTHERQGLATPPDTPPKGRLLGNRGRTFGLGSGVADAGKQERAGGPRFYGLETGDQFGLQQKEVSVFFDGPGQNSTSP